MWQITIRGGFKNPHLKLQALGLTAQEKADLVEFVLALTGEIALEVLSPEMPH